MRELEHLAQARSCLDSQACAKGNLESGVEWYRVPANWGRSPSPPRRACRPPRPPCSNPSAGALSNRPARFNLPAALTVWACLFGYTAVHCFKRVAGGEPEHPMVCPVSGRQSSYRKFKESSPVGHPDWNLTSARPRQSRAGLPICGWPALPASCAGERPKFDQCCGMGHQTFPRENLALVPTLSSQTMVFPA